MSKIYLVTLFTCFINFAYAQSDEDYWKTWDKNYPEMDITAMLKAERHYADSVESNPKIAPYYVRRGGYRFTGKFAGSVMPVSEDILSSMKRVYKLMGGNLELFANLADSAVLIQVDDQRIWMPIQNKQLKAFKEEVEKGDDVVLYCAYFNEHTSKKALYNNFLISEFFKEEENRKE